MNNEPIPEMIKGPVSRMTARIAEILAGNDPLIYLTGSVTLGDFRPGWSDIDILVLTRKEITDDQAGKLVGLRQEMLESEPDCPYYRSFEGGMLTLDAFINKTPDRVVYWGTSGQRVTDRYRFDSFSQKELIENGVLLYGEEVRGRMAAPTYGELKADVASFLDSVRGAAGMTGKTLYSLGWMLDISRCLYTLRTGGIIAKTAAGEWALKENVCPTPETLEYALRVRRAPLEYKDDPAVLEFAGTISGDVLLYADALAKELTASG